MIKSIASAYECEGSLNYIYELPPTTNNEMLYQAAYDAVTDIGAEPVDPIPSTGGKTSLCLWKKNRAFSIGWVPEMRRMTVFIPGIVLILKQMSAVLRLVQELMRCRYFGRLNV